jgi:hypothetical protein
MSISGYLIALEFNAMTVMPDQVTPGGQWTWRLSHQVGEIAAGQIFVPLGAYTESELMALAQEAAVVAANTATNNVEEFVVSDVRGGAI